jgi:hypothetical protein
MVQAPSQKWTKSLFTLKTNICYLKYRSNGDIVTVGPTATFTHSLSNVFLIHVVLAKADSRVPSHGQLSFTAGRAQPGVMFSNITGSWGSGAKVGEVPTLRASNTDTNLPIVLVDLFNEF